MYLDEKGVLYRVNDILRRKDSRLLNDATAGVASKSPRGNALLVTLLLLLLLLMLLLMALSLSLPTVDHPATPGLLVLQRIMP